MNDTREKPRPSLRAVWRLTKPYFSSDEKATAWILLTVVVGIELAVVGLAVLLNQWNNTFYNALQDRNWDVFVSQLAYFCLLASVFIVLKVYQLYLNQWLQMRWRLWLTRRYLRDWLADANHYRMQLQGDAADNPDQRIAEDIQLFVARTLRIGLGFLNSFVTILSFIVILWNLSQAAPLHLFGTTIDIPGYLVWSALIYSVLGTAVTHLIGKPLIDLFFTQQRYEADFRFNLVRTRENSEQIALMHGERAETGRLLERFQRVVQNWYGIMIRQKKLTFFTAGFDQISVIFPYVVVSPAYFASQVQLGALMQTASAFGSVQGAMSFFVTTYSELADWAAVIQRLDGFRAATAHARAIKSMQPGIAPRRDSHTRNVEIDGLSLTLPDGKPLVDASDVEFTPASKTLLSGPSGSGKSTLFRAIAGIWPFGRGAISIPSGAHVMVLPQRPYFPVATLAAALAYPGERRDFSNKALTDVLAAVGLPQLAGRLEEEAHWNRILSLGEQQRLAIARAILQQPDFLFLDEATASLDTASEAALYGILHERLRHAAIISIGHRETLNALHDRRMSLKRDGDIHRLGEAARLSAQ